MRPESPLLGRTILEPTLALAVLAFAIGVVIGPRWLAFLRARNMGKRLNPSEPSEHASKEGTPTMGGVTFLAPVAAIGIAIVAVTGEVALLIALAAGAALATLGALDDLTTLVGGRGAAGMSPAVKWVVEIAIALGAATALYLGGHATIRVPAIGAIDLPAWAYVAFAAFVIVATTSSVAITDGLDSLAATTCGLAFLAFWVVTAMRGDAGVAMLCASVVGALLAYLWFNAWPAQMWMGDVGSLPLGGLLGVVALLAGEPFLLVPAGIVFVANAASDVAQVLSVKIRGRRVLRYAPLHHHFERVGWRETWVVQRFWIVGAVGAMVAIWASTW